VPRRALVTGGAGGIGAAVAARLRAGGHDVVTADLAGADLAVDVTDAASVAAMAAEAGPVEVLVTCAGVISAAPVEALAEEEWDRVVGVNLKGTFLACRAVLPAMRERGFGRIVTIASDAGKTGEPWLAHYCASKFGVIGLTQALALEVVRDGVTVNAVCPAITDTPMMEGLARQMEASDAQEPPGGWRAAFVAEIPLGRAMAPADVAEACAFLAGDGAGAITGQALNVSGGPEVH
jgi:meso-butanediol dehydrogenase / (S,S)-butanediol dehydrogenase / diacetyl reductase